MISLRNIHKKFGRLEVLNNFNLDFRSGKSYALMGPNGSGKTTLIKIILGMVIPNKGEVFFKEKSIKNNYSYRAKIGYMPQIGRYPDNMKIGQLFGMLQDMRPGIKEYDMELVEDFGLNEMWKKPMHTLSGGTRQKVSAALAFMFKADVLILDEPTAGLDPMASETLKYKIKDERNLGRLILITSHILSDLEELADNAIYINEGNVFFNDTIESLKLITGEVKFQTAIATLMKWSLEKEKKKTELRHV